MNIILYGNNDIASIITQLEIDYNLFSDGLDIKEIVKQRLTKETDNILHMRFFKNKKFHIWIENLKEQTISDYVNSIKTPGFMKRYKSFLNKLYFCKNSLLNYSVTLTDEENEIILNSKHWLENKLKEYIDDEVKYFHILVRN